MITYSFESLGCAKNLVDSERFVAILNRYGFSEAKLYYEADLFIINSCAFICEALDELNYILCDIINHIKDREAKIIVTGCIMNRGYQDYEEGFPEVDAWIPLKNFSAFENYLLANILPPYIAPKRLSYKERTHLEDGKYVYLRIADGCNNKCSYCMIPYIRGKQISEPIEALIEEAKSMQKYGRELILIAQDICTYGTDLYEEKALPKLIAALHNQTNYDWIRLLYMHPDNFEFQWTELWKKYPKLLPYFDIPIQQVSPEIIQAMHRKKSYNQLKELFQYIQKEVPDAVFRTTLMVDYPNETKEDLNLLDKFLSEVPILQGGVFAYSPESKDPKDNIYDEFNWKKGKSLMFDWEKKLNKKRQRHLEKYVGTIQPALIERYHPYSEQFIGRLWFQAPEIDGCVYIDKLPEDRSPIVNVEIVDVIGDEVMSIFHSNINCNKE